MKDEVLLTLSLKQLPIARKVYDPPKIDLQLDQAGVTLGALRTGLALDALWAGVTLGALRAGPQGKQGSKRKQGLERIEPLLR